MEGERRITLSLERLEPRLLLDAAPVVTDPFIAVAITSDSGTPDVANIGDVVAVTWDNSAAGDDNSDISTVTADMTEFGGPAAATMVDDGTGGDAAAGDGIWTLDYTIQSGDLVDQVANASVTATNAASESTTTADTSNIVVNNLPAPVVTDANIAAVISTDGGTTGVADIGDVVTVTWDNSPTGDNNSDITAVTADLTAFGGSATATMVDDGTAGDAAAGDHIWTVQYTIAAGGSAGDAANASVTATNVNGDSTTTADTSGILVDNLLPPTVTDGNIAVVLSTDARTTGVADIGDVITVTWDNSASGDNNLAISTVTADLSQFGGPAAATMVDDGTGGDASADDGVWTLQYTIGPGDVADQVANASVTATNAGDDSATTADTSNIEVNNGPLTQYTSGGTVVSVYDMTGTGNISADDVLVEFGKNDAVDRITLLGSDSLEGLGLVISGAPSVGQIRDLRTGTPGDIAFIAADTSINKTNLQGGIAGYNLNGLTVGGITFADDIDSDGVTTDATGFYTTARASSLSIWGNLDGDAWLGGVGIKGKTLGALRVKQADLTADVSVEGRSRMVKVRGGDFSGNLHVTDRLHKLIIARHEGTGGTLTAGAYVTIDGRLDWARISDHDTSNSSVPFGLDLGRSRGMNLGGNLLFKADLPFSDGDFRAVMTG